MEKTEHEAENCSYPEVNPEPAQPEVPLGDVSSQHQKTTQHPSNNLPGNAKQKATPKNWSNDVMFSAAFDEWNNHRPTNDKGRPMSMAMFCELRCIPRMTFLRHCKQNKDTINAKRREHFAAMSDEKKEAVRKKAREDHSKRAAKSDKAKEVSRKKARVNKAKQRAAMSDKMKEASKKGKSKQS